MSKYFVFLLIVVLWDPSFADTVSIDGQKFQIDLPSQNNLKVPSPLDVQQPVPKTSDAIDIGQIQSLLQHLGYPEKKRASLEKEIIALLTNIDFLDLKQEAALVRTNPIKLKEFVAKIGGMLHEKGYLADHPPHPLIKLMTYSFVDEDISQVILASPISFGQKVDSIETLVECTAITQLGSIILDLLGFDVRTVYSPEHVFNCIPLQGRQVLFADFSNQIFQIVDTDQYYYNLASRNRKLKDQYHISLERYREIKAQLISELHADSLIEQLCYLYRYIYISDDYPSTPGIFINLANIYSRKNNYDQAFLFSNKAIDLDPENAEGYHGRGLIYANKGDSDQAIVDLNRAIELFPDFAEGYHDRGSIFINKGDVDDGIYDFTQAIIIDPYYAQAFYDRGKAYSTKGDINKAISDYDKAIEIDPYFSESYQSRAEAYYLKGEYDKSWQDIHRIEEFGDEIDPDLLGKLKNASMLREVFIPALIIAPIAIFLFLRFF